MTWIEDARAEVELAAWARQQMSQAHREHYAEHANPGGMFVGEHTGWLVVPGETVAAMLDAIEAAEAKFQDNHDCSGYDLICYRCNKLDDATMAALARVRERFEGRA